MGRRLFLKLTGLVAAASALEALPVSAAPLYDDTVTTSRSRTIEAISSATITRVNVSEPGLYRISGQVRLDASQVVISGISNSQTISWSGPAGDDRQVASFTTFEQIDRLSQAPEITVAGGQIESLSIVPIIFE
jgi:hypothetical protein